MKPTPKKAKKKVVKACKYCGNKVIASGNRDYHFFCQSIEAFKFI